MQRVGRKRIRRVRVRVFEEMELQFRVESPRGDRQKSKTKMMFGDEVCNDGSLMMVDVKKRCCVQVVGHFKDAVQ